MQSCVRKYSFIKTRRKKNKCHFLRIFFSILFCVDFLYAWFYGLLVLFFHQSPPVQCLLCVRFSVSSSVSFYFLSLHANQDHQQNLVDFTFPVSHVTMVSTYFFFILLTFSPTKSKVDMLSILSVNLVSFGPERQFYAIYPMIGLRKNLSARVVYIVCGCDLLPLLFQKRKTIFQQSFCNNWWMTAIMKQ